MDIAQFTDDSADLKNNLVDKVLLVGTSIGLSVFLISLFPVDISHLNADFFGDLTGIGILFSTYLLRNKISLKIKMIIINSILFLLMISDLLENGINTPDVILMVLIPFFTILVYELKVMLIVFWVVSIAFLGVGHLYEAGIVTSPDYDPLELSIFRWYETLLMLSVVIFVITLFVNRFNKRVYALIKNLEERNKELIKSKGLIKDNLNEKNVLLQEIHHRVKNNLAVVSGLLELQSYHIEDNRYKMILGKSTNRIMSIAKVHEMLYESKKFNNIPFDTYIRELSEIILSSMNDEGKEITFNTEIEVEELSINHGVPLGIIFNELITNSVKYGFDNESDNVISIIVRSVGDSIQVIYEDSGKGIENFEEASVKSLGFTLIQSLMEQIEAEYKYDTQGKFKLTFQFPCDTNEASFPIAG